MENVKVKFIEAGTSPQIPHTSVETADPFQAVFVQVELSPVSGFGRSESA